jgi:hypothetical protein
MSNIAEDLMYGPNSDRTRALVEDALRPAVDLALGRARPAVRAAVGGRDYDAIRDALALEAVDYAVAPLADEEFNAAHRGSIREFVAGRMKTMDPAEFSEMLRTAMRQDEWLLYLHGAVLGFGAGLLHLAIFG